MHRGTDEGVISTKVYASTFGPPGILTAFLNTCSKLISKIHQVIVPTDFFIKF